MGSDTLSAMIAQNSIFIVSAADKLTVQANEIVLAALSEVEIGLATIPMLMTCVGALDTVLMFKPSGRLVKSVLPPPAPTPFVLRGQKRSPPCIKSSP